MKERFDRTKKSVTIEGSFMRCETGCQRYDGDEAKHLETCPYYPESLTKLNADKIKELEAKVEEYRNAFTNLRTDYAESQSKLKLTVEALKKITKIRRKDGNDNEYEGAEVYISNEVLEKIEEV